ncbi:thioredoxin-disulfide reductase [Candidatus Mycoplasma haematohominis]|uniref:Thioredoxin reductase n=1 Tax=Candidatus Mycoplasma haematohominis TaxID=1494318 RepID=A0A478FT41_9MOLU|nr:thioredoxin-disulfide reductase [Candidatus Mycoplasma haemohominis]GCE63255.1 thioredoxin reductase [Candidatus Mycoplasma haemohominis]
MKVYDLVIIGAGPSGLSAALYSARAGLKVAFIEKEFPGGKLNKTLSIENYPGYTEINGPKLGEYMLQQVLDLGVEQIMGNVIDIRKTSDIWETETSNGKKYQSKTVLITTGMKERVLDIPNVHEYYGKGVSYCAICDGNLYSTKPVVVVGGGNSAVEEALYLADITQGVQLVHRRREYRADNIFVERMKKHVQIKENVPYIPIEITVKDKKVIGLTVQNTETQEKKLIPGDCVFFYVGLIPENYFLKNLNLELDNAGFIKVNEKMETSERGVFAAGDIIHKDLRQVITAASDGSIAAISIKNFLNNEQK